jgi:hypothetical protein
MWRYECQRSFWKVEKNIFSIKRINQVLLHSSMYLFERIVATLLKLFFSFKTVTRKEEIIQQPGGDVLQSVIYPVCHIFLSGCYGCLFSWKASISGEMIFSKKSDMNQLNGYLSCSTPPPFLYSSHWHSNQSEDAGNYSSKEYEIRRRKLTKLLNN